LTKVFGPPRLLPGGPASFYCASLDSIGGMNQTNTVLKEKMCFDPLKGGWVPAGDTHNARGTAAYPPHWSEAVAQQEAARAAAIPRSRDKPQRQSHHYEEVHQGAFKLGMEYEIALGLAPPDWSVSSKMDDPRPNGKALFDARFIETPVGRAKAGRSMVWDPRGTAHAGETKKAENWDAAAMADAAEEDFAGMAKEWSAQEGAGTGVRQASGF